MAACLSRLTVLCVFGLPPVAACVKAYQSDLTTFAFRDPYMSWSADGVLIEIELGENRTMGPEIFSECQLCHVQPVSPYLSCCLKSSKCLSPLDICSESCHPVILEKGPRVLGERVEGQAIYNDRDHLEGTAGQLLLSKLLHSRLIVPQERTYETRTKSPNKEYLKTICILISLDKQSAVQSLIRIMSKVRTRCCAFVSSVWRPRLPMT